MNSGPTPPAQASHIISWWLGSVGYLINAKIAGTTWLICLCVVLLVIGFRSVVG